MKWNWKENKNTWSWGEPNLGCGVYMSTRGWEGDITIYNESYRLQIKPTLKEAMEQAENRFGKLYEQYHELVN